MPLSGFLLRQERERVGLTRTELAIPAERSEQSILLYEMGRVQPPVAVLERIASALDVSVDSLLESASAEAVSP